MARVCIGMPVYNGGAYLRRALGDLSAQGFADLRILISDNASTDETPDILSDFAARDPRIVVHRQKENIGPVANYQWVVANSRSECFTSAAHDDGWSSNYVEELWRALEARPGAQLAAPSVRMMDIQGNPLEFHPYDERLDVAEGLVRVRLGLRRLNPSWFHGLYRREAFEKSWYRSRSYKHVWGFDPLVLLPFVLSNAFTGNNAAVFQRRVTGVSDEKYRPATAAAQAGLSYDFLAYAFRELRDAPLSAAEKVSLVPAIVRYGRHAGKVKRIVKLALKGKVA